MGYISYSPVYGTRSGWMHDLSRRVPEGFPGVMEAVNATAISVFQDEGVGWLHFGFTPFTGLSEEYELPGHSPAFRWFMRYLWEHGEAVYPARTQLSYKEKWAPQVVLPEYAGFQGPADLGAFAHIFRAANAF
ncbi:phosphatidylglycerol lysyltransferase domain-containing protein [Streptomyces iconiensis]|uniref:phosphatidylglycerol lysyltransferase domain-containing protein n=1 Tax=Streptomyces iconiensis TaxID=1384038 RepID=UPI003219DC35